MTISSVSNDGWHGGFIEIMMDEGIVALCPVYLASRSTLSVEFHLPVVDSLRCNFTETNAPPPIGLEVFLGFSTCRGCSTALHASVAGQDASFEMQVSHSNETLLRCSDNSCIAQCFEMWQVVLTQLQSSPCCDAGSCSETPTACSSGCAERQTPARLRLSLTDPGLAWSQAAGTGTNATWY